MHKAHSTISFKLKKQISFKFQIEYDFDKQGFNKEKLLHSPHNKFHLELTLYIPTD